MSLIPATSAAVDADEAVAELVEELANRLQAGEAVDVEEYIGRHPQHAEQLRRLLPAVRVLADLGKPAEARLEPSRQDLGDFRLLREVGRGGMGVVYEAEQLSLRRRVAVKVLPFAAVLDHRQLNRFRNEARAAALLQHPNIVPVYAVGHDKGVHFYAMQLIAGRTLAAVIAGLRRQVEPVPAGAAAVPAVAPHRQPDFFRAVARLGVQAAQALEHAHQQDVVHRDVKPGNLLVEDRGKLWVADFGLASVKGGGGLTSTGDLVGTLRYMSPEQVQSRVIDHRTDIYSLGVTLYEVLALAPAFPGDDRQELLRRVAQDEPAPLRRLNPATPADLQVIVGKAMAKDPGERYATAGAFADDLQRFLDDRPILARPPSCRQRARRWARRHRQLVVSLAVSAGLLLAGTVLALFLYARKMTDVAEEKTASARKMARIAAEKTSSLKGALLSEAAEIRLTRAPGYRKRVWGNLKRFLELGGSPGDLDKVRAEVLACVGDPIGLDVVTSPKVVRRQPPEMPEVFRKFLQENVPGGNARAVTPDGRILAWRSIARPRQADGSLVVLSDQTGKQKGWLNCPLGHVYDLQFAHDGNLLVAGSEEGVVCWGCPRLNVRAIFRTGNVPGVAVDPTGQLLATSGRQIELWSLTTSRLLASFPRPTPSCRAEFSADGKLLLAVNGAKVLCGWPVREAPEKRLLLGHSAGAPAVAFSPDGRRLASVSKDRTLRLWDAATGALLRICREPEDPVEAVEFSPDGRWVATGDFSGSVFVFDARSGELAGKAPSPALEGRHKEAPGQIWRLQFSARGDRLAAAGVNGVAVWSVRRQRRAVGLTRTHVVTPPDGKPEVPDLAFHPSGDHLVFLAHGRLFQVDLRGAAVTRPLGEARAQGPRALMQLRALHFDPSGTLLTFITGEGQLGIWDWRKHTLRPTGQTAFQLALGGGRWVATSERNRGVVVFDLEAGKPLLALPPEQSDVWGLAWSPDCRRLAVSLSDGGLAVWDLEEVRARLKEFHIETLSTVRVRASP